MRMRKNIFPLVVVLVFVCLGLPALAHGPSGHDEHIAMDNGAAMKASIRANDLSKAAVSYGQVLAVCASCHKKFRD